MGVNTDHDYVYVSSIDATTSPSYSLRFAAEGGTKSSYDNLANLRNPFGTVSKKQPAVNARRRHNRKHTKHQKNTAHGNRLNPFTDLIYTVIYIHSCDTPSQPRCLVCFLLCLLRAFTASWLYLRYCPKRIT